MHECAKSNVKSIFKIYAAGDTMCAPPPPIVPQGMIRQEYPGADRVKTKFRKQGLI